MWRPRLMMKELGTAEVNRCFCLTQSEIKYYTGLSEATKK